MPASHPADERTTSQHETQLPGDGPVEIPEEDAKHVYAVVSKAQDGISYSPLDPNDLEERLTSHEQWVKNSQQGSQICLDGIDLSQCRLADRDLTRAQLRNCLLDGADLRCSNLFRADFTGSRLDGADLRCAILRDVNLSSAASAQDVDWAGADLHGAVLPSSDGSDTAIAAISDRSRAVTGYFVALLGACAYTSLTVAATSDAGFFGPGSSITLPILGTGLSTVGFYLIAPFVLLGAYIHFHLELQTLCRRIAQAPAVFIDGTPVESAIGPWVLSSWLYRSSGPRRRRGGRSAGSKLRAHIASSMACACLPLTVLLLWGRYLRRADQVGTNVHVALVTVAAAIAVLLASQVPILLAPEDRPAISMKTLAAALLLAAMMAVGLPFAEHSTRSDTARKWVQDLVRPHLYGANLAGADLSYTKLHGAHLRTANLKSADMENADVSAAELVQATGTGVAAKLANFSGSDMTDSQFDHADLTRANLESAELTRASLGYADLSGANLQYSDLDNTYLYSSALDYANLTGATFNHTFLRDADLTGADLKQADLSDADLKGADLDDADLRGANLTYVKELTREQLAAAITDSTTVLPSDWQQ